MTPYYADESVVLWHRDARDLLPTLADQSIDFVFTDPPYGHRNNDDDLISRMEAALGRDTKAATPRPIQNDGPEANETIQWAFKEFGRLMKDGVCCCCCCGGGGGPDPQFARWSLWLDQAIGFKQMIVWDKGPIGMGWHYRRSYETVLVGQKSGAACRWFDTSSRVENIIRHIPKIIPSADQHPTEKPVELVQWFLRLHTRPGDLVLDPFCGSGTTLVAAKTAGCRAIGCDVDEQWLARASDRLRQGVLEFAGGPA